MSINDWYVHEAGQVLIATDGIGFHQLQGRGRSERGVRLRHRADL